MNPQGSGDGVQDEVPRRVSGQAASVGLPVISPTDGAIRHDGAPASRGAERPANALDGTVHPRASAGGSPIVAVLGDVKRTGRWSVPATVKGYAVLADITLDLREADLPAGDVTIDIKAVLGSVRVIVPPGMNVRTQGVTVLGDTKVEVAPGRYDGPTLTVRGLSILGDVKVRSAAPGEMVPKLWRWF